MPPSTEDMVARRLKRIMLMAGSGYSLTFGNDQECNTLFLMILREAYKALQEIRSLKEKRAEEAAAVPVAEPM